MPILKSQGAQVIVAVTHLPYAEDRRLLERFPQVDLVIGGHEHFPITSTTEPRARQQGRLGCPVEWRVSTSRSVRRVGSSDSFS